MIPTAHVNQLLSDGVDGSVYPGAVWAVGNASGTAATGAVGQLIPTKPGEPMQLDTFFDVASLTKILAVWSSFGSLWEAGLIPMDERLGDLWPEVAGFPLGTITARHLLTHTAGLPLRAQLRSRYGTVPTLVRAGVLHEFLRRPPGEAVEYTDRAALILGYLVEYLCGRPLDSIARTCVWDPLGMHATRFGPLPPDLASRSAPTEIDTEMGVRLRGTAHDFSARLLGGVCGISGVFSTAADLAAFLRYILDPGASGAAGFGAQWIEESLKVHTGSIAGDPRGLFWHPVIGADPAEEIWVHYGFTGTAMWVSPKRDIWATLLTNKIYCGRESQGITGIRKRFRELVFC
ncbi:serine hydrolase domain-containing protein [Streptomyces sp. NPDC004230]